MTEPRRLQGHKGTATCCIASRQHPGLVVTSGEDGRVCWFDMRCKDSQLTMEVGDEPVTNLCFKPGNEDIIYVSMGKEIKCFDVHLGASWKPLESYNYNKEEINQIVCSSKSSFLAAADDGGDIKIIDIRQQCLYKTLRSGHSSICTSVQFLPWRPWEVITGGLDSKLVMWDFSKGRPNKVVDFSSPDMKSSKRGSGGSQCFNPAFVHSVAVPDVDMLEKSDRICAVARGDGAIDVINVESELTAMKKSKNPTNSQKGGGRGSHSSSRLKGGVSGNSSSDAETVNNAVAASTKQRLHLDYSLGGHTAAVSCVAFSMFGERGRFIVSGGIDKSVKLWDWFKYVDQDQTSSSSSSSNEILRLNINLKKKPNWLCTTPGDSENLVVCDTSKIVKVYSVS